MMVLDWECSSVLVGWIVTLSPDPKSPKLRIISGKRRTLLSTNGAQLLIPIVTANGEELSATAALEICVLEVWGFPEIRGTILGVPIIRIVVFWGLYWGSLFLGIYQVVFFVG